MQRSEDQNMTEQMPTPQPSLVMGKVKRQMQMTQPRSKDMIGRKP